MELLLIGVGLGMIVALIAFMASIAGRVSDLEKEKEPEKPKLYTEEDMVLVLDALRVGCTQYERDVINEIERRIKGEKMD